jgi:hypothetical protein
MIRTTRVAPPNSLVLVTDRAGGDPPTHMDNPAIASSHNCVAIGCLSESDGETTIMLGSVDELIQGLAQFEGALPTPSGGVIVSTVFGDKLVELDVTSEVTWITVWTNDPHEPSEVRIGVKATAS